MDGGSRAAGGGETKSEDLNWTDAVEDFVDRGDVDGAISLLESVVSRLETLDAPSTSHTSSRQPIADLRLAAALDDLVDLHSSRGFSLKADELRVRSLLIRDRASGRCRSSPATPSPPELPSSLRDFDPAVGKEPHKEEIGVLASEDEGEDDWETIADRAPPDIGVTKTLSNEERDGFRTPIRDKLPKRRGRGSFMYEKDGLYSDEHDAKGDAEEAGSEEGSVLEVSGDDRDSRKYRHFGMRHVLVLHDFSPNTRTRDLEKFFGSFGDTEVAIRWVNDTCALAVFRTPAAAQEAQNSIIFPFKVRRIDENDCVLNQVSNKDLEPPYPRPKTSTRTAERMIAQVMGLKLSPGFGSSELRKQEQARKSRIRTRQILKEDAWGSDEP